MCLVAKLLSIYSNLLNNTILQFIGVKILIHWLNDFCILTKDEILYLYVLETTATSTKFHNVLEYFQNPYYFERVICYFSKVEACYWRLHIYVRQWSLIVCRIHLATSSPDFIQLGFFFWVYMKQDVYSQPWPGTCWEVQAYCT
jgi:hypothetical protein